MAFVVFIPICFVFVGIPIFGGIQFALARIIYTNLVLKSDFIIIYGFISIYGSSQESMGKKVLKTADFLDLMS